MPLQMSMLLYWQQQDRTVPWWPYGCSLHQMSETFFATPFNRRIQEISVPQWWRSFQILDEGTVIDSYMYCRPKAQLLMGQELSLPWPISLGESSAEQQWSCLDLCLLMKVVSQRILRQMEEWQLQHLQQIETRQSAETNYGWPQSRAQSDINEHKFQHTALSIIYSFLRLKNCRVCLSTRWTSRNPVQ